MHDKHTCPACGVPFIDHAGIIDTCYKLQNFKALRPFTIWAARLLEKTLVYNDERGKGPWETQDLTELMCKRSEEIGEVEAALENRDSSGKSHPLACEENRDPPAMWHFRDELVDEAVTCLMIAARIDPVISQLRRGRIVK